MYLRRVLITFGAVGALAVPVTSTATSAAAEESGPRAVAAASCSAGNICLYEGTYYSGRIVYQGPPVGSGSCKWTGAYRSVRNRTNSSQRLWLNLICTQGSFTLPRTSDLPDVGVRNSLGGFP